MTQAAVDVAYTPESINQQLLQGKSREELGRLFGHKNYKTLDIFMRRKGYTWDRDKQLYVVKGVKPKEAIERTPTTKTLQQALKLFETGEDPKEIARQLGFKSHLALADYMKNKGYIWNQHSQRYEYQVGEVDKEEPAAMQPDSPQQVSQSDIEDAISNNGSKSIPRYNLPGVRVVKTLQVSNALNELLKHFAEEKNITQREFLEIAIIEAMSRYGYEAEVKGVMS